MAGVTWHGVTYEYRRGHNNKWFWWCVCGEGNFTKTLAKAQDQVISHMTVATAVMRGFRARGRAGVFKDGSGEDWLNAQQTLGEDRPVTGRER